MNVSASIGLYRLADVSEFADREKKLGKLLIFVVL
jgi:hypothetical protein